MNWNLFNPTGVTGGDDEDLLYRSEITGPQGARYELLREKTHIHADVEKAKRYLRRNFDVVSIQIIHETD
jgi:hypothetical protein